MQANTAAGILTKAAGPQPESELQEDSPTMPRFFAKTEGNQTHRRCQPQRHTPDTWCRGKCYPIEAWKTAASLHPSVRRCEETNKGKTAGLEGSLRIQESCLILKLPDTPSKEERELQTTMWTKALCVVAVAASGE